MTTMRPTLSFVSLAVADVSKSRRFYEALGLEASGRSRPEVALFQLNGVVLALAEPRTISKTLGVAGGRHTSRRSDGVAGVVLSHNVGSEAEVDAILATARAAGGRIKRSAGPAPWGGRSGCFRDPDGHLWEVVFNRGMAMDAMGNVLLEPPDVW